MKTNYVISLEIGSSAAKIGAASFDADLGHEAPLTVIAIEEESLTNCVRYGRIQNVEDVTQHTMLALDRLNGRAGVYPRNITGVYTSIGGRSLASCKASAQLNLGDESEITQKHIEQLKDEALLQVPHGRTPLEVIPLRYTVDDVVTHRPVGAFGSRIKAEFTIVYCDPLNERNLERVIVERLNLDICGYVVRPLAIANLALTDEDTRPGCMLVDLGAETTTVAIFKDGALQYLATIPLGSHNITRDLAAGLGVVEHQAEQIKIRLGNAYSENVPTTAEQIEIDNFVQARVTEIIANILAHIGFAGFKTPDLCSGIIITGRGAKLKNLSSLLQMRSRLQVRVASIPTSIQVSDPAINPGDNIDVIAVAHEAMLRSYNPEAVPCLTALTPQPPVHEPEPEPEVDEVIDETPAQPEPQPEQPYTPGFYYTGATFGGQENPAASTTETPVIDIPSGTEAQEDNEDEVDDQRPDNDDEEYLLLDDDEQERLKDKKAKKAAEARLKAEKKAAEDAAKRKREEEKKLTKPSILGRLRNQITRLIESEGDGIDLDD